MESLKSQYWLTVNQKLIAKSISELGWEECFSAQAISDTDWSLALNSGIKYRFSAWKNIWGQLVIDPQSIQRQPDNQAALPAECARQFYIDAAAELGVSSQTLANLLEEIANTLMADWTLIQKQQLPAGEMIQLADDQLQALLDGHPKITANKGRMGWGYDDYQQYATEAGKPVKMHWLALRRQSLQLALAENFNEQDLLDALLSESDQKQLQQALVDQSISLDNYFLLPVHPWQWQNKIISHFASEIASKNIIHLGALGDGMLPLQSLRTLANADRSENLHIKLPLTILNTSCYRGIPGKFITAGPVISQWLANVAKADSVLASRKIIVLQEPAGAFYPHKLYQQIEDTPYRYLEMLGCIWRESLAQHLKDNQKSILMSVLFQKDSRGNPLIFEYIERSGLSSSEWLERLFDVVVVPLYHLLCCYGVGLVAHGQNISLVLKDHQPYRVAIKDFQGDLRLTEADYPQQKDLPMATKEILGRLPEHYLLHDLLTGHFVTVMRFISTVMADPGCQTDLANRHRIEETEFYLILGQALQQYMASQPQLNQRYQKFDLFKTQIERICLHKVRFRLGYGDTSERPVPQLGTPLDNPLVIASSYQSNKKRA